jgi:hypothetical protein
MVRRRGNINAVHDSEPNTYRHSEDSNYSTYCLSYTHLSFHVLHRSVRIICMTSEVSRSKRDVNKQNRQFATKQRGRENPTWPEGQSELQVQKKGQQFQLKWQRHSNEPAKEQLVHVKYKISATTRANTSNDYKRLNLQRRLFTRIFRYACH